MRPVVHGQEAKRQEVRDSIAIAVSDSRGQCGFRSQFAGVGVNPAADERFEAAPFVFFTGRILLHRLDVRQAEPRLDKRRRVPGLQFGGQRSTLGS